MKDHLRCAHCGRDQQQVPLITIHFEDVKAAICPEHLPILIHRPEQLEGKLPGVENLSSQDHL